MSWNSFSLDLFKVTFYFLPWSITVKPPLEEYFFAFSNHQTSKSKFLHLNCMKKSTCFLLNPRDWSGSKQAPVRRLLGTPLWKRWRDGARDDGWCIFMRSDWLNPFESSKITGVPGSSEAESLGKNVTMSAFWMFFVCSYIPVYSDRKVLW